MQEGRTSQTVFLVGMKHTGKSLLAKIVARQAGYRAVDTDLDVEHLYLRETGRHLGAREIFRSDDGSTFRRLETIACRNAAGVRGPAIVATGGGICDNAGALAELQSGFVVTLEADCDLLFSRIMKRGIPAFMSASNESEAWNEFCDLYDRRAPLYREMAHVRVQVGDRPPAEAGAEVIAKIEEHLHGGK